MKKLVQYQAINKTPSRADYTKGISQAKQSPNHQGCERDQKLKKEAVSALSLLVKMEIPSVFDAESQSHLEFDSLTCSPIPHFF